MSCRPFRVKAVDAPAFVQIPADRLAGDVVALDGSTLHLRLNTGQALAVTVPADARLSGRALASLDDIAPGRLRVSRRRPRKPTERCWPPTCISSPRRGAAPAKAIYPLSSAPDSMMTNATIARVDAAARDGSTVPLRSLTRAGSWSARPMTLKYHGGEQSDHRSGMHSDRHGRGGRPERDCPEHARHRICDTSA